MITFQEAYNRLSKAYFKGKVNPYESCCCFVGNLLNNTNNWFYTRLNDGMYLGKGIIIKPNIPGLFTEFLKKGIKEIDKESDYTYNQQEIADIESVFLKAYTDNGGNKNDCYEFTHTINEYALWKAFNVGLNFLADIHRSKGQIVNWESGSLVKRELVYER